MKIIIQSRHRFQHTAIYAELYVICFPSSFLSTLREAKPPPISMIAWPPYKLSSCCTIKYRNFMCKLSVVYWMTEFTSIIYWKLIRQIYQILNSFVSKRTEYHPSIYQFIIKENTKTWSAVFWNKIQEPHDCIITHMFKPKTI